MKKSEVTVELVERDDPAEDLSEADRRYMRVGARYRYRFSRKGYSEERDVLSGSDGLWEFRTRTGWSPTFSTVGEAVDAARDDFLQSIKTYRESVRRKT